MGFIGAIFENASYLIWGASAQAQPPSDAYELNLLKLIGKRIDQNSCITNCSQRISGLLQTEDCNLSQNSLAAIQSHVEDFDRAIAQTPQLSIEEINALKTGFKQSLMQIVEQKWAALMAESFYPILIMNDKKAQVDAVLMWAYQYFQGLICLHQLETACSEIEKEFVAKLETQTCEALSTHIQKNTEKMFKRVDSLAPGELSDSFANPLTTERQINILKECIWLQFDIHREKLFLYSHLIFTGKFQNEP